VELYATILKAKTGSNAIARRINIPLALALIADFARTLGIRRSAVLIEAVNNCHKRASRKHAATGCQKHAIPSIGYTKTKRFDGDQRME
jgi:hypothetical protein